MNPSSPWLDACWRQLCAYIDQNRIPQALLITGNKGLGKRGLAERFAGTLLCSNPSTVGVSCGRCHGCKLYAAGNHPDLFLIAPEEPGKAIGINQIRELIADTQLKPQYDTYRVVIIDPAEQMNRSAANAFLKCLEEPAERTVIILISSKPAKLPPTITSRCQRLAIKAPDRDIAPLWLDEHSVAATDRSSAPSKNNVENTSGDVGDAMLATRNACFKSWVAIARHRTSPVAVAEEWQKLPLPLLLFWLTSWLVDIIKCKFLPYSIPPSNSPYPNPLQELAAQLDLKSLYQLYDLLLASYERIDSQVNKQMMLEEILILWSESNRR